MQKVTIKRFLLFLVFSLMVLSLTRAERFKYQDMENAIRQKCKETGGAKIKEDTPEIRMVTSACLIPGQTGDMVIKGKFPQGSQVVLENDNLQIVAQKQVGDAITATIKAASGIGPESADVLLFTPNCRVARHSRAVAVGGKFEWELQAQNGWKITARLLRDDRCGSASGGDALYEMNFFRNSEQKPFEQRQARLYFEPFSQLRYQFGIEEKSAAGGASAQMEMQQIMQKIADPKLSDDERNKVMARINALQKEMMTAQSKILSNPAEYAKKVEAERQAFGCTRMELGLNGNAINGWMRCSDTVGNRITISGSLKSLGR
jgi:hypothetical protein